MPMWKPGDHSKVYLSSWNIKVVEDGRMFFCGYELDYLQGRVSTEIKSFDKETRTGVTRSGRIYELVGNSGYNGDAEYVWGGYKAVNNLPNVIKEITDINDMPV